MTTGKYTWQNQRVPKPATGKTPVRNLRLPDEVWLPALAKAEAEEHSLTSVIEDKLRSYVAEPLNGPREFTYGNWPGASQWARERTEGLGYLHADLGIALGEIGVIPLEWLTVAVWLASTHHQSDTAQQKRVVTGHILRFVMAGPDPAWRARYRDSRHLSETVQAILERHLPLSPG